MFPKEELAKERQHEEKQYSCAIYKLTPQSYLDPYKYQGQEMNPRNNPGVWLNHSWLSPNAKVVAVREAGYIIGCVVIATEDISAGEEVIQDYGRGQGAAKPSAKLYEKNDEIINV